jgi:hypothetical protein
MTTTFNTGLATPTLTFPKLALAGLKITSAPPEPVPESATVCGEPAKESLMVSAAVRVPATIGLNVTDEAHEADTASEAGQFVVTMKSPAFAPVSPILEIASAKVP